MPHCFICDETRPGPECPVCGSATWSAESGEARRQPDERPQAQEQPDPGITSEVEQFSMRTGLPPTASPARRRGLGMALAGLLVGVLALWVLPAALQTKVPEVAAPEVDTPFILQTLPAVFWVPPTGTEVVAAVGRRAEVLWSTSRPVEDGQVSAGRVLDIFPDGSLLVAEDERRTVVHQGQVLLELADVIAAEISPNGQHLAIARTRSLEIVALDGLPPSERAPTDKALFLLAEALDVDAEIVWDPASEQVGVTWASQFLLAGEDSLQPGRLMAFTANRLALWTERGLEVRSRSGGPTIRVSTILPPHLADEALPVTASFHPSGNLLAIHGAHPEIEGLWLLDLVTTRNTQLAPGGLSTRGRPMAWNGDGSALLWVRGGKLLAWLVEDTLVAISDRTPELPGVLEIERLRVYDASHRPTGTILAVANRRLLVHELGEDSAEPRFEISAIVQADDTTAVAGHLWVDASGDVLDRPMAPATAVGVAVNDSGAFAVETVDGELHGSDGFIEPGTSITSLGDAFLALRDGFVVHVGNTDLALLQPVSEGEPLALAAVGDGVLVIARNAAGTSLIHIPATGGSIQPPLTLDSAPTEVFRDRVATVSARFVAGGHEALAAVVLDTTAGPVSWIFYRTSDDFVLPGECGLDFCVLVTDGVTVEAISPDGDWLLVEDGSSVWASSTRGRGNFALPSLMPGPAAWLR